MLRKYFTFIIVGFASLASAFTPQPGSPLALHQHPRMHITQQTIPMFKQVIADQFRSEFQEYVNWAADADPTEGDNILSAAGHDPLRALIVHQAFIAALGEVTGIHYAVSPETFAQRAIDGLQTRLDAGDELSFVAALAYDWTFNFMTETQRRQIAEIMRTRTVTHKVYTNSIANPSFQPEQMFSSKYYEGAYPWYMALAFWGDGFIDDDADKALDTFHDVMMNYGFLDAHNFVAGETGGWSEWIGYASWHMRTEFLNIDAWTTATGENVISGQGRIVGNAAANYPKLMSYALDPHKYFNRHYTYIRQGGAETTDCSFEHRSMREQMLMLPRILDNGGYADMAGLLRHIIDDYDVLWPGYTHFYLWGFLGIYRMADVKTPDDLNFPKSMWSRNMGTFFARTGFNSSADGVFTYSDGHFRFEGHSGPDDTPAFTLAKYGGLVNFRTVAHRGYGNLDDYPGARMYNVVYFDGDPYADRQSIDTPAGLEEIATGQGNHDYGGIEQVTGRDGTFYFIRSNRSRSFSSAINHTRELVYIPGQQPEEDADVLVIYDRTSSSAQPEWVYHVPWLPEVSNYTSTEDISTGTGTADRMGNAYNGNMILIKELNSLGGERDSDGGDLDYVGSGGAHGVAFCRTILPQQARIEVTRVAELSSEVIKRQHHLAIKSYRWQVSVKPTQTEAAQRFLNVFQTGEENKLTHVSAMQLVEVGAAMQGVFVEAERSGRPNKLVLFSKEDAVNENTITYSVSESGVTQHIISGVKPYTIYDIQQISDSGTTTFQQGTEPDMQLWDYKGVAVNVPRGVLFFETTVTGNTTFVITPAGEQDVTPPTKPQGMRLK